MFHQLGPSRRGGAFLNLCIFGFLLLALRCLNFSHLCTFGFLLLGIKISENSASITLLRNIMGVLRNDLGVSCNDLSICWTLPPYLKECHVQPPLSVLRSWFSVCQSKKLSTEEGPLLLLQQKSRMPLAGLVYFCLKFHQTSKI